MYPGLTNGAAAALAVHGSDELKRRYLPKMTTGEWTGTMNLTEPHCGTDLGLHQDQGGPQRRRLLSRSPARRSSSRPASTTSPTTSSISCSRASRARRPGRKGISLFVVPKFLVDADGVAGRAQRRRLRLDRAQDGHPRQRHLRDELRRRQGLAGRRGESRPQRDVRDDERGAARRRACRAWRCPRSPTRTPPPTPRTACRAAR